MTAASRHVDVLHVITDTDRRGAQTFACDLHEELSFRGVTGDVVALRTGSRRAGLEVRTLDASPTGLAALRREVRRAGVVVAHGSTTLRASAVATAGTSTPFVYRSIGDPSFWASTPRRRVLSRALLTRPRTVVALWSGAVRALRALGVPARRIEVIPQAAPLERFPTVTPDERKAARRSLRLSQEGPVVALVGALSAEKRPLDGVDAVAQIEGASLVIAGDGPLCDVVRRHAEARLPGRSRILGPVPDVRPVLIAADALILPSATEGMPGIAIEAGLTMLPVVATDVGGTSEVVVDGVTGFLAPAGSVAALSTGLRRALDDAFRLGRAARVRCETRFDIRSIADRWEQVLDVVRTTAGA